MAAPWSASATAGSASSGAVSVPLTGLPTAADQAVMVVGINSATATVTTPSGWTLIDGPQDSTGGFNRAYLFGRTMDGTETSVSCTVSSSFRWAAAVVGGPLTLDAATLGQNTTTTSDLTLPGYTPGVPDALAVGVATYGTAAGDTGLSVSPPAGWTEIQDNATSAASGANTGCWAGWRQLTGSGSQPSSTGTVTGTPNGNHRGNSWVVTFGSASHGASGGSSTTVDATPTGHGTKTGTAGSTAAVDTSVDGAGTKSSTGASAAAVSASAAGTGGKTTTGSSTTTVDATARSDGTKQGTAGSAADVTAAAVGHGVKHTASGSTADVDVTATGDGTGGTAASGGSHTTIDTTATGTGAKTSHGGMHTMTDTTTTGVGAKTGRGGSRSGLVVAAAGLGTRHAFGGGSSTVAVTAHSPIGFWHPATDHAQVALDPNLAGGSVTVNLAAAGIAANPATAATANDATGTITPNPAGATWT